MTEFETKAIALLESINRRLAHINSDTHYVAKRERNKAESLERMIEDASRLSFSLPKLPG